MTLTTMRRCFCASSSPFCFKGGRRRGGSFRFPRFVATRSFNTSSSLSDDERRDDDEYKEDEKGLVGGASIYSKPDVYALAFGTFRDFPKEVDFLHKLYESVSGKKLRTLLELGCGPAWHSIEHAKKVLREDNNIAITATTSNNNNNKNLSSKNNDSGIVSVALDVNKEMVSYAIERASDERAVLDVVDVVLGDMRDLSTHLPEKYLKSGGYFDCATLLLGTAAHLLTCEDATRTFREAFKCLREDGIFVVEVEHPMTTLFSGELKYQDGDENAWEVSLGRSRSIGRSDDRSNISSTIRREEDEDASEREETMRVVWGDPEKDFFDAKNQVLHRTVSVQKYFSVDVAARDDDDDDGEEEEEDKEDEEIEEEEENDNFEEEAVIKALFVRDPHYESKEIVKCKLFTLPELMAVANAAGFEFIECFGDLDETVRFDSENAQNMVVCFRKNGERENEE
ncbi:unnamed protein product [Bathycoccus prasinos]